MKKENPEIQIGSHGRWGNATVESDTESESLWLVPYGNMMTVLMVLFLILYSFAYLGDTSGYEKIVTRLQSEFAKLDRRKAEKFEPKQQEAHVAEEIADYFSEKGLDKIANVDINAQRIRIQLATPVLFGSGEAALKTDSVAILNEIATLIRKVPNKVIIEGHTDNIPIKTAEYSSNWELSVDRAINVINYFGSIGILPERFAAAGYGEFQPVSSNDTPEGRSKNRRIEIIIVRT